MINLFLILISFFSPTTIEIVNPPPEPTMAIVTAYSSTENQTDSTPFLTASQKRVQKGFIACPRHLPFGTIVELDGREYNCQDRMNIRYTNRYDVWMESEESAKKWGIKKLEVKLK